MAKSSGRQRPYVTALVGSRALLREGIAHILGAADFNIVASAPSIDAGFLNSLGQRESILLLIDAADDTEATIRQVEIFKEHHPAGCVAVLADRYEKNDVISAFGAGVGAYLIKVATPEILIKLLELAMLGVRILPPELLPITHDREDAHSVAGADVERSATVADRTYGSALFARKDPTNVSASSASEVRSNAPALSGREECILRHIVAGNSNKTIARKIDITEGTVKVHVKAIFRKICVRNRTQAAMWAINKGLVVPETEGQPRIPLILTDEAERGRTIEHSEDENFTVHNRLN